MNAKLISGPSLVPSCINNNNIINTLNNPNNCGSVSSAFANNNQVNLYLNSISNLNSNTQSTTASTLISQTLNPMHLLNSTTTLNNNNSSTTTTTTNNN